MNTEIKKLYRSRNQRMIGGVCGGLGEYFGIDPTLVRLAFVLATVLGLGGTIVVYIILLLIVPEEPIATVTTYPAQAAGQAQGASIYDIPGQETTNPSSQAAGSETVAGSETGGE